MSFGKFLAEGSNWASTGLDGVDCWRAAPKYPKLRQTKRRHSRSAELVVHNSGEAFVFEESGSNNSDHAARRQRGSAQSGEEGDRDFKLYFPSSASDENTTRSYNSPTISPGRSETDRDSSEASNDQPHRLGKSASAAPLPSGGSGSAPPPDVALKVQLRAQHKRADLDSFLHNGHEYGGLGKAKSARTPKRGGGGLGGFFSQQGEGKYA